MFTMPRHVACRGKRSSRSAYGAMRFFHHEHAFTRLLFFVVAAAARPADGAPCRPMPEFRPR